MKKTNYLVIGLLAFVSCTTRSNEFSAYISKIETLPLPITVRTLGNSLHVEETKIDQKLFKKFKHIYADNVSGKIYETETGVGILYIVYGDAQTPVLVTYDNNGHKIDSLNLFRNASGFSPTAETFVTVTLYADRTIHETDSTVTEAPMGNQDNTLSEQKRLKIDSTVFTVNETGKIIITQTTGNRDASR